MRRKLVAGSLICLLIFPMAVGSSGCSQSVQTNVRRASLGVLEAMAAIQDTEMELYKVGKIPIAAHRAFNAKLERCLILGRDFNRTAWLYPASTVGLDQGRALTESLGQLAKDVTSMMPDGTEKNQLMLLINAAQGVISTALILVLEKRT